MTKEEIEELVSKLPDVEYTTFLNPVHDTGRDRYCYIVYRDWERQKWNGICNYFRAKGK